VVEFLKAVHQAVPGASTEPIPGFELMSQLWVKVIFTDWNWIPANDLKAKIKSWGSFV
jgi:hypothetical protein